MIVVCYADDLVSGFEHEDDASHFLDAIRERFRAFSLSLHPGKPTTTPGCLTRGRLTPAEFVSCRCKSRLLWAIRVGRLVITAIVIYKEPKRNASVAAEGRAGAPPADFDPNPLGSVVRLVGIDRSFKGQQTGEIRPLGVSCGHRRKQGR
jgi:hypothetical protein